jgi:predicted N-acetyltransferase YhbS
MDSKIEKLEACDYPILATVHDGLVPDPKTTIAMIAREGDNVIGRVFLMAPVHVEGPWVDESKRGSTLGKRLMDAAEKEAKAIGIKTLMAYGADSVLENYLERLGYRNMNLSVWAKEL